MPQNFLACDREQELMLPPSLREWLPDDHLAWFVLAAVEEMDLTGFYAAYRRDGHGRAAHDPAMMVALVLYAYATGRRSSRAIERACVDDLAVRVVAANQRPDHCTIARFRQRHEAALAGLFAEVLALCADAGLVGVAVLAVDGTKLHANASQHQNLNYDRIAAEILAEADAIDRAEDERFGDRRAARAGDGAGPERLLEGRRRLEEDHDVQCRANAAYEAYRAGGVMKDGRRFGRPPTPYRPPATPAGKVNVTDPDSRNVKTPRGYVQ